jgi:hypothetical protein
MLNFRSARDPVAFTPPTPATKPTTPTPVTSPSVPVPQTRPTDGETLQTQSNSGQATQAFTFLDTSPAGPGQAVAQLQKILAERPQQGQTIPPQWQQQISDTLTRLEHTLVYYDLKQPDNQQRLLGQLASLQQQLAMAGVRDPQVRAGVTELVRTAIGEIGAQNGISLETQGGPLAITALRGKYPLQAQQGSVEAAQTLAIDNARAQVVPRKLTPETVFLMSVRDELLRRQLEMITPPTAPHQPQGTTVEQDLGIISNAVSMVDNMLASTRELPPDLLADMGRLAQTISDAPIGQIQESINRLRTDTGRDQLLDAAGQLPKQAGQAPFDVPGLQQQMADLGRDLSTPANELGNTVSNSLNQAGQQLRDVANQGQQVAVPPMLNDIVDLVSQGVGSGPPDMAGGMGKVIEAYSQGMGGVRNVLPPLLFPITMPIPLAYNNGDTTFVIPAGSRLSQDRRTGDYTIQGPGMYLQTGGTTVQAAQSSIQLGRNLDRLNMVSLDVNDGSTHTSLHNVTAEINRAQQSSVIRADKINVNSESGQVEVLNARITQNPDQFHIGVDSFLSRSGDELIAMQNAHLTQTQSGDISNLQIGAEAIQYNKGDNAITADRFVFEMTENAADSSSLLRLQGDNINVQTADGQLKAVQGGLEILNRPDGSSDIVLATQDASFKDGPLEVLANGETSVRLTRDASGQVRQFSAQAQDIQYRDGDASAALTGGSLEVNYGDTGLVQGVNAKADQLRWNSPDQTINATGAALDLRYGEDGNIQAITGDVQNLTYAGNGQQLTLNGGHVNAQYGENGLLQQVTGRVDQLNWQQNGQTLDLSGGQVGLQYTPEGTLSQVNGSVQSLTWQDPTQGLLTAEQGNVNLTYGANGNLQQATATIQNLSGQTTAGDALQATGLHAGLTYSENGLLQQATAGAATLQWQGANGDKLSTQGLGLQLNYGENGLLQQVSAQTGATTYQGALGQITTQGQTSLNALYREDGTLASLQAHSDDFKFASEGLQASAENTTVTLQTHANGLVSQIGAETNNLQLQGDWGQFVADGTTKVGISYSEQGNLSGIQASSDHLTYLSGGNTLDLTGTTLSIGYNDQGQLTQAIGTIQQGSYAGAFGQVDLTGGDIRLNYGDNGVLSGLQAGASQFKYAGEQGILDLQGAQLNANYGPDGLLQDIRFQGDGVNFTGATTGPNPLNLNMGAFDAHLVQNATGGQTFNFTGQQLDIGAGGHQGHIDEIRTLQLITDANGAISQMDLHLPGHNTYTGQEGNITAALDNLQANYTQEGNRLTASFDRLEGAIKDQGLSGFATGGQLEVNDRFMSLHVDSAQVIQKLEKEMNVKVENLDLLVHKNENGGLASADLQVGSVDAALAGMNVMVRTANGDRVRLHMETSADGTMLKEAFLQIPSGGEISLSQKDMNLRLGGDQRITFSQDGQGRYTLRDDGINIDFSTKEASVQVRGGSAQVTLDSKTGDLIIDEIKGTAIHAEVAGQKIDVDIQEMEGFLVRATGYSGLAQGAALHLVPTSDNSRMTAEIRTNYNGIPIAVKIDNVHELKALATLQPNRAHVYFGDPSGQGKVSLSAGPLEMKGSAIEFVAQYHTHDPQRLMSSVSRAMSSDGVEIFKGVQIEADGVVRLQTPNKNGPHAELAVMLPRPPVYQHQGGLLDGDPWSNHMQQQGASGPQDGAAGGILTLGWKGTNREGSQTMMGVHTGLVPGSYLSIDQTQGKTTLAGVELPKHIAIPTTGIAGVTYRKHSDEFRLDVMAGGYVNPAAFGPSTIVQEPNKYGAYGGFQYREGRYSVGVMGTADLTTPSKPKVGATLNFGISF